MIRVTYNENSVLFESGLINLVRPPARYGFYPFVDLGVELTDEIINNAKASFINTLVYNRGLIIKNFRPNSRYEHLISRTPDLDEVDFPYIGFYEHGGLVYNFYVAAVFDFSTQSGLFGCGIGNSGELHQVMRIIKSNSGASDSSFRLARKYMEGTDAYVFAGMELDGWKHE